MTSVDGSEILHQLICSFSHYVEEFINPRWFSTPDFERKHQQYLNIFWDFPSKSLGNSSWGWLKIRDFPEIFGKLLRGTESLTHLRFDFLNPTFHWGHAIAAAPPMMAGGEDSWMRQQNSDSLDEGSNFHVHGGGISPQTGWDMI